MSVAIAWGITGASHFLKETFETMHKIVRTNKVKITTYLSSAGAQVVRICGLWDQLQQISTGSYLQEVLTETEEGAGSPRAGRLLRGIYKVLIVSPTSGNTVAKAAYGIADTLVTNAIAQAQKRAIPVYLVPTDQKGGFIETTLLYRIERSVCKLCDPCPVVTICPYSAIRIREGIPNINLASCQNCRMCITACPFNAVKYGEKIKFRVREIDLENVEKLKRMNGITILERPEQIEEIVRNL
ncbi:MAG: dihydromethanopterin reductase (acceptor) [Candidatus Bathyarchaeia archaeon]